MADKPGAGSPHTAPKKPESGGAGHLGTDDRGNITWEWKQDEDLLADDTLGGAERIRALVDPGLDVVDDADDRTGSPISASPKRLKTGYNPYNSGALGKQTWKKTKDLRELSKWIELRKKMAQKKDEGQGE